MSLESGLGSMKVLRELRKVVLPDMEVYIDGEEQAWLSEHWPNAMVGT